MNAAEHYQVLQTKPAGYAEIPHSALVAKRLSQCLNPVLPSGVHSKALEVYGCIFEVLGVCMMHHIDNFTIASF